MPEISNYLSWLNCHALPDRGPKLKFQNVGRVKIDGGNSVRMTSSDDLHDAL